MKVRKLIKYVRDEDEKTSTDTKLICPCCGTEVGDSDTICPGCLVELDDPDDKSIIR